MGRRLAVAAPLVFMVLVGACSAPPAGTGPADAVSVPVEGGGSYSDLLPETLHGMLEAKDFVLVNVHVPYEGEIARTDLFLPYDQIAVRLGELPQDRDAKIVLYCRSGSMSATAARELVTAGYTNVWNLDGGMNAWQAKGYPLTMR